jgi:hypothetical protein
MKRYLSSSGLVLLFFLGTANWQLVQAQDPITAVIKAAVTKAIVAMDLQIQRLQNETIWLQNAQKVLENKLSELQLNEIADWSERQRQLYAGYYAELWQVKASLAQYQRVRDIIRQQAALVAESKRAFQRFQQEGYFTPEELDFLSQVYSGMLGESVKHLDQLILVISPGITQMSDGKRLALLEEAATGMEATYSDLRFFNNENIRISLQRANERHNLQQLQRFHGFPGTP